MHNKLAVLDWIRALAILIILFHHLPAYTFNYYDLNNFGIPLDLSVLNDFNRYFGISLFVFASGYLLNLSRRRAYDLVDIKKFVLKRWIRIFPLYILAFTAFVYLYNIFRPASIFAHLLGLQLFFASPNFKPSPTLWFIGLILVYYSIFLIWKAKKLSRFAKIIVITGFPVLVLTANTIWGVMDFRLLLYYAIFWFGMYCGTSKVLDRFPRPFIFASLLTGLAIFQIVSSNNYEAIMHPGSSPGNFLAINILMLSFVIFSYCLLQRFPDQGLTFNMAEKIAYASYCMYLFHRPFWSITSKVIQPVVPASRVFMFSAVLIFVSLPVLLLVCAKIQQIYDRQIAPPLASYFNL